MSVTGSVNVTGSLAINGFIGSNLRFANDQQEYFITGPKNGGAIRIRSNSTTTTDRVVQLGNIGNDFSWNPLMTVSNDFGGAVGIGTTTPEYLLTLNANATQTSFAMMTGYANANARNWGIGTNVLAFGDFTINQSNALGGLPFGAGTSRLYISQAGNVGIGNSPNAWDGIFRALQIGNYGSFIAGRTDSQDQLFLGINAFYGASGWVRQNSTFATRFFMAGGEHFFDNAVSNTAGTSITWDTRMKITSAGNIGIGTSSPSTRLEVTSGLSSSTEVQRWSYNAGDANYSLRLKQDVSSGLVKHIFDVVNNGTTYSNNLVLTNGNVGIGTTSPNSKLDIRGVTGTNYTSNVTATNNNTNITVLNPSNSSDFYNFIVNTFGTNNFVCLVSIIWDSGNAAASASFMVTHHVGYNGNGIVRLAATTYNGDVNTDGSTIFIRNNGGSSFTPTFKVVLLHS